MVWGGVEWGGRVCVCVVWRVRCGGGGGGLVGATAIVKNNIFQTALQYSPRRGKFLFACACVCVCAERRAVCAWRER